MKIVFKGPTCLDIGRGFLFYFLFYIYISHIIKTPKSIVASFFFFFSNIISKQSILLYYFLHLRHGLLAFFFHLPSTIYLTIDGLSHENNYFTPDMILAGPMVICGAKALHPPPPLPPLIPFCERNYFIIIKSHNVLYSTVHTYYIYMNEEGRNKACPFFGFWQVEKTLFER